MNERDREVGSSSSKWVSASAVLALLALCWWALGILGASDEVPSNSRGAESTVEVQGQTERLESPSARPTVDRQFGGRRLQRSGKFIGRVVVDEGSEADVSVCALWFDAAVEREIDLKIELDDLEQGRPTCVQASADGSFELDNLRPGAYLLLASSVAGGSGTHPSSSANARTRQAAFLSAGQAVEDIVIVLSRAEIAIRGVVNDVTGGPIEGAAIYAVTGTGFARSFALSDEMGQFEILADAAKVTIVASSDGYASDSVVTVAPHAKVVLRLVPESRISGRVVSATDGVAIPDVSVSAREIVSSKRRGARVHVSTKSDGAGQFEFSGLRPGIYALQASSELGLGQSSESVRLGLAESVDGVVLRFHAGTELRGRVVVMPHGKPCPSGYVTLHNDEASFAWAGDINSEGLVQMRVPLSGSFSVEVVCDGHRSAANYERIFVDGTAVPFQTWRVSEGARLTGFVESAPGQRVPNATVVATQIADSKSRPGTPRTTTTDEHGEFVLRGLERSSYSLRASSEGFARTSTPTISDAPAKDVRLLLGSGGVVYGKVQSDSGDGVVGVHLAVRERNGAISKTNEEGAYELVNVAEGERTIIALDKTHRPLEDAKGNVLQRKVDIVSGQRAELNFEVAGLNHSIRGRVVDVHGGNSGNAFVVAVREMSSARPARLRVRSAAAMSEGVLSDQDGSFEIHGLAQGRFTLLAMVKGGGEGMVEHVATGSEVEIPLGSISSVSGSVVVARDGAAPERYLVQMAHLDSSWRRRESFYRNDGQWEMYGVPPGRHKVSIRSVEGTGSQQIVVAPGGDVEDVRIELVGQTSVHGRIVYLKTGKPVIGYRVVATTDQAAIRSAYSFADRRNITNAEGEFEITASPTGRVTLHVIPEFLDGSDPSLTQSHTTHDVVAERRNDVGSIKMPAPRIKDGEPRGSFGFTLHKWDHEADQLTQVATVIHVQAGGPAARAGLSEGDVIVGMDGIDVTGNGRSTLEYMLRAPQKTRAQFELKSGKKLVMESE